MKELKELKEVESGLEALRELKEVERVERGGYDGVSVRKTKSMGEGGGVGEVGLSSYKRISSGREIRDDKPDKKGGDINTPKHSGGTRQTSQEIVCSVFVPSEGVSLRSDNIGENSGRVERVQRVQRVERRGDGKSAGEMQRYSWDAKWVDQEGKELRDVKLLEKIR